MEIRYIFVLIICVIFIPVLIFIPLKKKISHKKKIANTSYLESLPYYKKKKKTYKSLLLISEVLCIFVLIFSFLLLSRPSKTKKYINEEYNRDIMLCMDVSGSVQDLNAEVVDALKETVKKLEGERFGIVIFNTTAVTISPLTDDYNFILDQLDLISKSIKSSSPYNSDSSFYEYAYVVQGTVYNSDKYGGSLIGDGLVSCVNHFSEEDENRTKLVIFTTDNELAGKPLFTLDEAAQYTRKKDVVVYGIATRNAMPADKKAFRSATEYTGGKMYEQSSSTTVKEIVNSIEKTSKSLLKVESVEVKQDTPELVFYLLIGLVSAYIVIMGVSKI